ncbi:uncharacterized protein LOC142634253 [Castanea sativa]|uniref:uncharacterized protein LOC142634253 n=1 Tax=Castanea sativa TaxID=21020 RepID=UPI003F654436
MGAGVGIVIITPKGLQMEHFFRLGFKAFKNEAEYEALLAGLRAVFDLGAQEVEIYSDSRLVVNQVQGNFEAKDPWMIDYLRLVKQTMSLFQKVKLIQIARGQNRHANSLAILASSLTKEIPQLIKVEVVKELSIDVKVNISIVAVPKPCWMDLIIDFLAEDHVPYDEKEAKRIRRIAAQYLAVLRPQTIPKIFWGTIPSMFTLEQC